MTVCLLPVGLFSNDSKVRGDVEPADSLASQRDNVIDLVFDACVSSQSGGVHVELPHRGSRGPWRSRSGLSQFTMADALDHKDVVPGGPFAVCLAAVLGVIRAPFLPVLPLVLSIFSIPVLVRRWVGLFPRSAPSGRAFSAGVVKAIGGCASLVERANRQLLPANVARLHLLVSMCASMMRRTSSAIDIPRRLASRFRKALCGSVNEIICLITVDNHPVKVQPAQWAVRQRKKYVAAVYVQSPHREVGLSAVTDCPQFDIAVAVRLPRAAVRAEVKADLSTPIWTSLVFYRGFDLFVKSKFGGVADQKRDQLTSRVRFAQAVDVLENSCIHEAMIPRGIQAGLVPIGF